MANKKISQLDAATTLAVADLLAIVQNTTSTTKKITAEDAQKIIAALTAYTAPQTDDLMSLIEIATGDPKRITLQNLLKVVSDLSALTSLLVTDELLAIEASTGTPKKVTVANMLTAFDGWIPANETWTYASATTVTTPGDVTAKYPIGTKIKMTNSGVKYFYVTAASYGAPNTTLTLTAGTSYTVANAAITLNYYSYASTPQTFPQWFNYTPSWINLTVGNGTLTAKFMVVGRLVSVRLYLVFGSTTSITASGVFVSVPIPVGAGQNVGGNAILTDTGSANYASVLSHSGGHFFINVLDSAGTYVFHAALSATAPFTWVATDIISLLGMYEIV
jgi:hypothetical protein